METKLNELNNLIRRAGYNIEAQYVKSEQYDDCYIFHLIHSTSTPDDELGLSVDENDGIVSFYPSDYPGKNTNNNMSYLDYERNKKTRCNVDSLIQQMNELEIPSMISKHNPGSKIKWCLLSDTEIKQNNVVYGIVTVDVTHTEPDYSYEPSELFNKRIDNNRYIESIPVLLPVKLSYADNKFKSLEYNDSGIRTTIRNLPFYINNKHIDNKETTLEKFLSDVDDNVVTYRTNSHDYPVSLKLMHIDALDEIISFNEFYNDLSGIKNKLKKEIDFLKSTTYANARSSLSSLQNNPKCVINPLKSVIDNDKDDIATFSCFSSHAKSISALSSRLTNYFHKNSLGLNPVFYHETCTSLDSVDVLATKIKLYALLMESLSVMWHKPKFMTIDTNEQIVIRCMHLSHYYD